MKIKYEKHEMPDLVADVDVMSNTLVDTLNEFAEHPRRLTCLRDAEETAKEILQSVKYLKKLYEKKV
jgi:hypothetical protein